MLILESRRVEDLSTRWLTLLFLFAFKFEFGFGPYVKRSTHLIFNIITQSLSKC